MGGRGVAGPSSGSGTRTVAGSLGSRLIWVRARSPGLRPGTHFAEHTRAVKGFPSRFCALRGTIPAAPREPSAADRASRRPMPNYLRPASVVALALLVAACTGSGGSAAPSVPPGDLRAARRRTAERFAGRRRRPRAPDRRDRHRPSLRRRRRVHDRRLRPPRRCRSSRSTATGPSSSGTRRRRCLRRPGQRDPRQPAADRQAQRGADPGPARVRPRRTAALARLASSTTTR